VILAGCRKDDMRDPFTDSRIPPGVESRFFAPDGWAWGLIKVGDTPAARYGVSAPSGPTKADIVILASYGEPAEVWFETARDLNDKGYVVWVLEEIGQGGSGRYSRLRDLGYAESLTPDVWAVRAMAEKVVRRAPLILMASGTSAPVALQAMASGVPADGMILTSPKLLPDPAPPQLQAVQMEKLNLGWVRADLHGGWSRQGPDDAALGLTHDPVRGKLRLAWQTANPDLRMGSASWSWLTAFAQASHDAQSIETRVPGPVLMLQPDTGAASAREVCRRIPHCAFEAQGPAGQALELEVDAVRRPWLSAVDAFAQQRISAFSPSATRGRAG
jgi:lysophospholipase